MKNTKLFDKFREFMQARKGLSLQEAPLMVALIGSTVISAVFIVYAILVLRTSLNNTTLNLIIDNATQFFTYFFAQFGTIGTIAGVGIMIGLVGLFGYGVYAGVQAVRGKSGKSSRR